MNFRTDLAIEMREAHPHPDDGLKSEESDIGDVKITKIEILNRQGEQALGKPKGRYITVESTSFAGDYSINPDCLLALKTEIVRLLPETGPVLICGIGNTEITPDALGPKTASLILATRHISGELAKAAGLGALRPVAVMSPGVLGQTGVETGEMIQGVLDRVKPAAVIVIDALASRRLSRLGCTVQLSDTGIVPGSGVGNARSETSMRTLGIPVLSIGVPTVVDAKTLVRDLTDCETDDTRASASEMVVTPKEIDLIVDRAARLIAHAVNCALQPQVDPEDLLLLVR